MAPWICSDELLEELDIVIAAVHSAMNQSQEQMTKRLIRAMENPNVDVLAHPTCRLLPGREPVAVDMEAVFQAAAQDEDHAGNQRHAQPA